jgi:hypothetical protein
MSLFELIDPIEGAPAPPGPWATRSRPTLAFSSQAPLAPDEPLWKAEYPEDLAAARRALRDAEAILQAQAQALDAVPTRLRQIASSGAGFSNDMAASERELIGMIYELQGRPAAQSFGLGSTVRSTWNDATEQFRRFTARVYETISRYAMIETRQAEALIGRTRVGWSGDMHSHLQIALSPEQADLHQRTVALALQSRATLLKNVAMVGRGAAILATMISSPAGAVLAMPAAWKYIDSLLQELR